MTDSSRSGTNNKTIVEHSQESKQASLPFGLAPSWLNAAGHIAVLALQNVEQLESLLAAVKHLGAELLDHWAAEDHSEPASDADSDDDTEEVDWE